MGLVRVRRDGCSLPSDQREGPRGARTALRAPGRRCPPPLPTHATPRRLLEKASSERHGPAPEGGYLGLCPARAGPQQPMGGRRRWVRLVKPQPRDNGGGGGGGRGERNVGWRGGAVKEGAYPAREHIGRGKGAWSAAVQSGPLSWSVRKSGRGQRARALSRALKKNLWAWRVDTGYW